jgi:hypothetical protein
VDRLTQAKLALLVMAVILLGGSLWLQVDWPRYVGMGLLVLALFLRAFGRRRQP